MAAQTTITFTVVLHGEQAQTAFERYIEEKSRDPRSAARKASLLLDKLAQGQAIGKLFVDSDQTDGGSAATGSVVCTQASGLGSVLTLGDATFTVVASPSTNPGKGELAAGADDTAFGDNLEAAINAHPALKGLCTAENAAGTVTITMVDKGLHGHRLRMTETGSGFTITQIASGTHGTVKGKMRAYRFGV